MKKAWRSWKHALVCFCTLTGEDNEENDCDVDEEELEVPEVTEDLSNKTQQASSNTLFEKLKCICSQPNKCSSTYRVEQSHSNVLDHAVKGHELEHAEGCDEGSTSLPVKEQNSK